MWGGGKRYLYNPIQYQDDIANGLFSDDDFFDLYDSETKKVYRVPASLVLSGVRNTLQSHQEAITTIQQTLAEGIGGKLQESLTSTKDLGGINNGQTFPTGTDLETLWRSMLIEEEPPTYLAPIASLSANYSNNQQVEAGTELNVNLTGSYNQRDGGVSTYCEFFESGGIIHTDVDTPYSLPGLVHSLTDLDVVFKCRIHYEAGPIKNTNLGNPYPSGQIQAGYDDSNTITVKSIRKAFYGVSAPSATSADIRALSNSVNNPANNTQFTINIPAGATSVVFAYPASLPVVESVTYVEGLNADVKGIFAETTVNVEGANGFTAIAYRVYRYEPASPFDSGATYIVKI